MEGAIKSIRLKNEVIEKVESLAQKENRSFSNMVETILMDYFTNYAVIDSILFKKEERKKEERNNSNFQEKLEEAIRKQNLKSK